MVDTNSSKQQGRDCVEWEDTKRGTGWGPVMCRDWMWHLRFQAAWIRSDVCCSVVVLSSRSSSLSTKGSCMRETHARCVCV